MTRAALAVAILTLLPATLLVAISEAAGAEAAVTDGVATSRLSFGLAGPVGIVAVILGLGGLVAGLLRRRRATPKPAVADPRQTPTPEPARTETPV